MDRRDRTSFGVSVASHALLVLGVVAYVRTHPMVMVYDPPARTIEIDFALAPLVRPQAIEPPRNVVDAALTPAPEVDRVRPASTAVPVSRGAHAGIDTPVAPPTGPEPGNGSPANLPPVDPFLGWAPHGPAAHAPGGRAPLRGIEILAGTDDDSSRAGIATGLQNGTPGASGATEHAGDPAGGPNTAQIQEASAGYVRRLLDDATPTVIAGSVPYFTRVAHEATRVFRPMNVPTPSLAQTVLNTFFTSQEVAQDATRRSLGPLGEGRSGRAAEEAGWAHPNSAMLQPANTMSARAAATARTTTVEIEIDQDATGHIVATRVLRRSGVTGFDRTALEAIQQAVRGIDPPTITGLWRSHWAFDVTTSRDPLISALPGVAGGPIVPGLTAELEFDEVTGQTEMHLPGMAHTRRRVRLVSSHVVNPANPANVATPAGHSPAPHG